MAPSLSEKDENALNSILGYCENADRHIEKFGNKYDDFKNNLVFQEACSFDAIQMGEAANRLSEEYKEMHPDVPWHQIIGLRNAVAHAYGHIDLEILWETVTEDFPRLRDFCRQQLGLE